MLETAIYLSVWVVLLHIAIGNFLLSLTSFYRVTEEGNLVRVKRGLIRSILFRSYIPFVVVYKELNEIAAKAYKKVWS